MNDTRYDTIPALALATDGPTADTGGARAETVEEIYQNCYQELFRYLLLSGCDGTDAKEFLQEGFLRMVRHLKQGKSIATPKHWLLRVLHNIRCDEYQRTSRYVAVSAEDLEQILSRSTAAHPNPESAMLNRERYERVRAAMANLTDRQYQCVLLRANGLKLREIADLYGISVVTVAEACGRAMEKLGRLKHE